MYCISFYIWICFCVRKREKIIFIFPFCCTILSIFCLRIKILRIFVCIIDLRVLFLFLCARVNRVCFHWIISNDSWVKYIQCISSMIIRLHWDFVSRPEIILHFLIYIISSSFCVCFVWKKKFKIVNAPYFLVPSFQFVL